MGSYMKMLVFSTIMLLSLEKIWGARTLDGEQWMHKNILVLQSLPRGPVKNSQKNPCSTVPGRGKGRCALEEMNVAGHVAHAPPSPSPPPPLFPDIVPKFGRASINADESPLNRLEKHLHSQT